MLANGLGARRIFERWLKWNPDHNAWNSFINFELRYGKITRVRKIYEKYCLCRPGIKPWIQYASFEEKRGNLVKSKRIYERALEKLGENAASKHIFAAFAEFETKCHEY